MQREPSRDQTVRRTAAGTLLRASALEELSAYPSPELSQLLGSLRNDKHPLVRRAAASAAGALPAAEISRLLAPLLDDPVRSVRIEAASAFLGPAANALAGREKAKLEQALAEYVAVRKYNADRAEGLVDLADLARRSRDFSGAEHLLNQAIGKDPSFGPAHLNLADLYREQSKPERSIQTLKAGLKRADDPAMLEHALGLALVRANRHSEGLKHLRTAYRESPEHVRLGYVYAIALFDTGSERQAVDLLRELHESRPGVLQVLSTLADYCRRSDLEKQADRYAERLEQLLANE